MRSICRPVKRTRHETCLPLGLLVSLLLMLPSNVFSQDTLYFENGNFIEGEIKNMEYNLLKISADYGGEDFTIEWDQIKAIYTSNYYEIHLSDGTFHFGRMRSVSDSTIHIISNNGEIRSCHQKDILSITGIGQDFRSRFTAGFDIGFGLAKANNLRRFTTHANVGYRADKWHGHANVSALYSFQDETEPIKRLEEHADFHYMLINDWTFHPSVNFLASTEQKLSLRSSTKLGIGKFFIREKHGYWNIVAGTNLNIERFTNETPDRNSLEGYFGTEIKLIKLKDLDLFTKAMAFPSFTESGRWRFDFNAILKYHLPHKLYINTKFTLNYDNQPAEGASGTDYVLHLGLGWSW